MILSLPIRIRESTVEESTLGLLPNPLEKQGVKFAVTYIGEVPGNASWRLPIILLLALFWHH
jgi:hypothetical protein